MKPNTSDSDDQIPILTVSDPNDMRLMKWYISQMVQNKKVHENVTICMNLSSDEMKGIEGA